MGTLIVAAAVFAAAALALRSMVRSRKTVSPCNAEETAVSAADTAIEEE